MIVYNLVMKSNGELVKNSIDLMNEGFYNEAFVLVCAVLKATLQKSLDVEDVTLFDYKEFVSENWELILFMCLPNIKSQYLEKRFVVKEISLNPHRDFTIKEIVVFLITQTLKNERLPAGIKFFSEVDFDRKDEKLFVPITLVSGLLGLAVVHPVNKDEFVPNNYWINISDFKMFISELWGRIDLAQRVLKFYRGGK